MSRKIVYALSGLFALFLFNSSAFGLSFLNASYDVTVNWGDGTSYSHSYNMSSLQSDPLGYNGSKKTGVATASAAAGMWGNEENYSYSFWMTDGTGVGQNDPSGNLGATTMTIDFDFTIQDPVSGDGGFYSPWWDQQYLEGTVGGEGSYVSFNNETSLSVISADGSTDTPENSLSWSYYNNTVGDFHIDSGGILPDPLDMGKWFEDGEMLHFTGTYTFEVDNHGGPSSINFTPIAPVPEPTTMLLFGTGLVGLLGSRIRKKKQS